MDIGGSRKLWIKFRNAVAGPLNPFKSTWNTLNAKRMNKRRCSSTHHASSNILKNLYN